MAMNTGAGGSLSDINITPLVDVMLVLLVIFMVTAPMMSAGKAGIKIPDVDTGESLDIGEQDVVLELDKKRMISFQGCKKGCIEIPLSNLIEKFRGNQRIKNRKIYLYAHRELPFGTVLEAMAKLRIVGVPQVGLVTDPAGGALEGPQQRPPPRR